MWTYLKYHNFNVGRHFYKGFVTLNWVNTSIKIINVYIRKGNGSVMSVAFFALVHLSEMCVNAMKWFKIVLNDYMVQI